VAAAGLPLVSTFLLGGSGLETEPPPQAGLVILDEGSYWRAFYTWKTPVVRQGEELILEDRLKSGYLSSWEAASPFPPEGWMEADFDDSCWSRWPGPIRRIRQWSL